MDTQFFRQDLCSLCLIILTLASGELSDSTPCLDLRWRRRWRASSTPRPLPGATSFDLFCLSHPACRSPGSLLLAFGGWSRTGSGDTAVTGPSPDILMFNPARRFEAATLVSLTLEQVLAEDGAEPASACGLHFCCRFEQLDDCKVLNFHPVVDGQVFLCGGAREVEQCSRHLWLFQPQQMQVCLSTGVRG